MSTIFLKILNISFTAGWLILAVIALRLLLNKAPKWILCLLWGLVAVRLLIPFSIESALSLVPSGEIVSESIVSNASPSIDTGFKAVNNAVNPIITETFAPQSEASINPMRIIVTIATVIWIVGMVAMFIYSFVSFVKLKNQVSASAPMSVKTSEFSCRVMVSDDIKSPFILGIFKPVIYIPSNLDLNTIEYVCAHENAHIKRHDNLWKPLGFILLSIYWFNPLCWIAYILLCKDIESACDEKVIKDKDKSYLALYSQALLDCAVQRKRISACPLAFGENGVKGRVKGVLSYKRPAFWIILISLVAIVVVAVCFLTNPIKDKIKSNVEIIEVGDLDNSEDEIDVDGPDSEVIHFSVEIPPTNTEDSGNLTDEEIDEGYFEYNLVDGKYVTSDDRTFECQKILVGKDPAAVCIGKITVLTNEPDEITYEIASKSMYSSNMDDWLTDSVIVNMEAITEDFEGFSVWPTTSTRISAEYDENGHPETDIAGEVGDPVYSIADGTIFFVGWEQGKGNTIRLLSKNAVIEYTHLNSISVEEGVEVKAGDTIGELGNTGLSTGPHLGLALTVNGLSKDMKDYYKN